MNEVPPPAPVRTDHPVTAPSDVPGTVVSDERATARGDDVARAQPATSTSPIWARQVVALRAAGFRSLSLLGVLALLCVVGTATSANFLTASNLINILTLASVIGVVTVGATFVVIGGGIDLSVGAIVAVATVWRPRRRPSPTGRT